ncbi:hypothetical protein ETAA8_26740 [Anatilimnocola aggregata]|uniref:Uncharacterized protein n=1 Tax=Anatilimnocola aggregata TaxID=2528021 RepID=A0A517YBG6_9BACT|nr:hypothetical protein [Anatilimnocola aggregata]QDU27586.1 hypothetical protein ETAA8_26740 [Anatilimnocola aggregata]
MSLDHDFLLLDCEVDGEPSATGHCFFHDPRAIHLHDDLVRYLSDTLAWIPTFNPALQSRQVGLNMWGMTIIEYEGAEIAERVFGAWSKLFACGPSTLQLTGCFGWGPEQNAPMNPEAKLTAVYDSLQLEGGYEPLHLARDPIVSVLQQLANYAAQVRAANGRLYIYHFGV